MTATTDLDGKLRAWLDLMPDEAPDRAVAAILQAVEATPQPRRSRPWPRWRSTPMTRAFVSIGAAIVIVVAGAVLVLRPASQPTVGSSPIPSSPAGGSAASALTVLPVPDALAGAWMGSHRSVVPAGAGVALRFSGDGFTVAESNNLSRPVIVGRALLGIDQRLQLRADVGQCSAASFGLYNWELSPSGRILTLAAANDPCGDRQDAVVGTYWRMTCRNPGTGCLGDLDAGTYASQYITPRLESGTSWSPEFGGITYTVPDGWSNSEDWPSTFTLTPSASYATEDASGPPGNVRHEVYVFAEPAADIQNAACDNRVDPSVGRTVGALTSWLGRLSSLTTTPAVPITIDGQAGKVIDITLRAGYANACPGDTSPSVGLFSPAGPSEQGWGFGVGTGEHVRLILLDLGSGHVLGIAIDDRPAAGAPSRFDSLVNAAMPVVESFHFGP